MLSAMTVLGPIDASNLGITLPHEHLCVNLRREMRIPGLVNDEEFLASELLKFKDVGGTTIIDVTPAELTDGSVGMDWSGSPQDHGPDPVTGSRAPSNVATLVNLAQRTGVNIIAGTGHYRDPYLDRNWFDRNSVAQIADYLIQDINIGFPNTDVRAGIIGEIGSDKWYLSAAEERSFRAAAKASVETGLAVTTHASGWPVGIEQVKLLMSAGVAPDRIIVGHVDLVPALEYPIELARMGAFVQLDGFFACVQRGNVIEHELDRRIQTIMRLVRAGFGDRILLSHDCCIKDHFKSNGGSGFSFIVTHVLDRLIRDGLEPELVNTFLTSNVRKAVLGG